MSSLSPDVVEREIVLGDPTLTTRRDSDGTVRAYRDGSLVGLVDVRGGRIVHAEHDGRLWTFWPSDGYERYVNQVASWHSWLWGSAA